MISIFLSLFIFSYAEMNIPHSFTERDQKQFRSRNAIELLKFRSRTTTLATEPLRPVAEYEEAGYLIFDAVMNGTDAHGIKLELIKNLAKDVIAVVLIGDEFSNKDQVEKDLTAKYEKYIDKKNLKFVRIKGKTGYWQRDILPIPIWLGEEKSPEFGVVDAKYFKGYEFDDQIAKRFKATRLKHSFTYEGGNFLSDAKANCVTVKGRSLAEDVYKKYYGCKKITYLEHRGGIGHVDERVKFLSDTIAVTDTQDYKDPLEKLGYKVYMLPKIPGYRTFVNALQVNKNIYMPFYSKYPKETQEASDVYKSLGFDVFGADSEDLSEGKLGSIHCSTMTYPPVKFETLVSLLNEYF